MSPPGDATPRGRWLGGAAFMVAAVALVVATSRAPVSWPEYRGADGRFALRFPGPPRQSVGTAATAAGPVLVYTIACITSDDDEFYKVEYADGLSPPGEDPETLFDRTAGGAIASFNAGFARAAGVDPGKTPVVTEVSSHPIWLQGWKGRESTGDIANHRGKLTVRVFLVDRRVYLVTTGVHADHVGETDARFLDSFKLLP
jgi:hypothetical protein